MANENLTPESNALFELSVYLKAWQRETGYNKADFEEAADWIDNYFKEHPITDQNANIYRGTGRYAKNGMPYSRKKGKASRKSRTTGTEGKGVFTESRSSGTNSISNKQESCRKRKTLNGKRKPNRIQDKSCSLKCRRTAFCHPKQML